MNGIVWSKKIVMFCIGVILGFNAVAQCPDVNVVIFHNDTTVCYNSTVVLNVFVETDLPDNDYQISWESSVDGTDYSTIAGSENVTSLNINVLSSLYYRCVITPTDVGCDVVTSSAIRVEMYGLLNSGGEISCSVLNQDTAICYNTTPNELRNILLPEVNNVDYTFQWQQSTLSSSNGFSDIDDANGASYMPDALLQTTYYRRLAIGFCDTAFSNVVSVFVYQPLERASILPLDTTICYMAQASMRINVPASGGNGVFSNRWQVQDGEAWYDIESATEDSYTTVSLGSQSLQDTAYYYRLASESTFGCGTIYSDAIMVNVYGDLVVENHAADTLCYMTSGSISVSATGEGGEYAYQWQESADGVLFSDVQDSVSSTFTTEPHIGGSMYYRCIVMPVNGCEVQAGDVIEVVTYPEFLPGTISGNDTICYNTAPDMLDVVTDCSGGGNRYSYMWQWSETEDGIYSDLPSDIPYQSGNLTNTTYYRLRYVSDRGCGTVYSDPVKVLVYQPLERATIIPQDTTICYMTQSSMRINVPASGGNDVFSNRWQVQDGETWHDIGSATEDSYTTVSLGSQSLQDTVFYYRLASESTFGCGTVYSDSIVVNVYGDLVVENHAVDTLCYMTSEIISVSATGEGGEYTYQWQESADGLSFSDVQDSISLSFTTSPHTDGSVYYRCIVMPVNGCEGQTGDVIEVVTYPELLPGTISGNDTICYNTIPEILDMLTNCTGGGERYSYMWQSSETEDGVYSDLSSSMPYHSGNLTSTTYYRLRYVSEVCNDSVYSDTVKVHVNPLPVPQLISGSTKVCINQYETYSVDTLYDGFSYEWSDDNNYCTINTPIYNIDMLEVLWNVQMSSDSIVLRVTNDTTGCVFENRLGVSISGERAPDRTIVARKPNSDILVTKEDDETLFYQWGFTERSSSTRTPIENSNRRYVKLPHSFDYSKYDYWLVLRTMEKSSCYSESYYSPDNDTLILQPETGNVKVVPVDSENIMLEVHNPNRENVLCAVYNTNGQMLAFKELGSAEEMVTNIQVNAMMGVLLVRVVVGNDVSTVKTVMR